MGQLAQFLPLTEIVGFYHRTVDIEAQLLPIVPATDDLIVDGGIVLEDGEGGDLEAQLLQPIQTVLVGGEGLSLYGLNVEDQDIQLPFCGDGAGKLAQICDLGTDVPGCQLSTDG